MKGGGVSRLYVSMGVKHICINQYSTTVLKRGGRRTYLELYLHAGTHFAAAKHLIPVREAMSEFCVNVNNKKAHSPILTEMHNSVPKRL